MTKFRIRWTDPETGEPREETREFSDTPTVPARAWAEDWAYAVADKGATMVEELT